MKEPELITIIEGPTPEFRPTPQRWVQSVLEGPEDRAVAICQLRTNNGEDIMERCERAWEEGRTVHLDYPDEMRMRQRANVSALRLEEKPEGMLLHLWVSLPIQVEVDESDEDSYF